MENITKEQLIESFQKTKEHIIKSNILLTPKWSAINEDILEYVTNIIINVSLREMDDPTLIAENHSEEEKKAMMLFASLSMATMEQDLKNNEGFTNKIYDAYVSGELDFSLPQNKEMLRKRLKEGLISHEQYEKIAKIDKPEDNE